MAIFDKEASFYDSWYETKLGKFVDKVETECALNLFSAKNKIRILDVGCGTGNFSIKLAELGCKVIGIDPSEKMIKLAKEKAENAGLDIEFFKMDVYNIDFEDEFFDGVFSMAAFEFIDEPGMAIEEIFRVTKKGGNILIGTINKNSKWGELYLTEDFQNNTVFKYAHFKTIEDLKKLKPDNIIDTAECLFIPPNVDIHNINMKNEIALSRQERGGFICVLWQK